jgi:hypothetical protein
MSVTVYKFNVSYRVQLRKMTNIYLGVLGFDSRQGLVIFLFTTASRTALGPTEPPVQWVPAALSLGVKRWGREADQSPPSSAEVKEWVDLYLDSPNTPSWRGAQLKHRENFTLTFYVFRKNSKTFVIKWFYQSIDTGTSRCKVCEIYFVCWEKKLSMFNLYVVTCRFHTSQRGGYILCSVFT